tara:strand:- start:14 stop:724 length:711 start_codon:yes stop_codon:yes gene_type:complete
MTVFEKALKSYTYYNQISPRIGWEQDDPGLPGKNRIEQLDKITNILREHFRFDCVNCIETGGSQKWEDGMVGYYFANLSNNTHGEFTSVDIDPNLNSKIHQAYYNIDPDLKINHITDDSLNLLKNPPYVPNLVHLDSWDVNLNDPFPSALHGWREFEAIESIMPVGSIIIIDDNWYKGMWVQWNTWKDNKIIDNIKLDITYPCIGKGAHIYQYLLPGDKNWKILDADYKLVIQKQW